MTKESKAERPEAAKLAAVDLTLGDTAGMTMILKAFIEQNQRLLILVESVLHSQTMDKVLDRQYRLEREKHQDELLDYVKVLLPVLMKWLKPTPPPHIDPLVSKAQPPKGKNAGK